MRNVGPGGETSVSRPPRCVLNDELMTSQRQLESCRSRRQPAGGLPTSQEARPPCFFPRHNRCALTRPRSLPDASLCSSRSSSFLRFRHIIIRRLSSQWPGSRLFARRWSGRKPPVRIYPKHAFFNKQRGPPRRFPRRRGRSDGGPLCVLH